MGTVDIQQSDGIQDMRKDDRGVHSEERIIDAVIPSFYPDEKLLKLVNLLEKQTEELRAIRIINTEKAGLENLLSRAAAADAAREKMPQAVVENAEAPATGTDTKQEKSADPGDVIATWLVRHPLVKVTQIERSEFDHGGTRHLGMELSWDADYVLFMTQDAVPQDENLVKELLKPFLQNENPAKQQSEQDENSDKQQPEQDKNPAAKPQEQAIAVSYARQLPAEDARAAEQYSRTFNYPAQSRIKSAKDIEDLGIKTFFCSNVCAMYRRNLYEEIGPFPSPVIFNEDMVYAGRAVQAGYSISYAADAKVIHSHNYSAKQQFHRNFDLGVSQADHPEIFAKVSSEGEGVQYAKRVVKYLWKNGRGEIPGFLWTCGWRLIGYRLGKNYRKLSEKQIAKYTMNPAYWEHTKKR